LIVPFLASGFGIFLLRQYFLTIPRDLYEAAVIDGCGRTRYLWAILLPLSRPALGTLAVYAFLNTWNQYYWPLLVTDSTEWRTTQVGIAVFRSSEIAVYNLQMAATLIVLCPTLLLLILGQRQLVRGLTAGALKGSYASGYGVGLITPPVWRGLLCIAGEEEGGALVTAMGCSPSVRGVSYQCAVARALFSCLLTDNN
jgi:ABC-type Fe3+ transport system permease subunit